MRPRRLPPHGGGWRTRVRLCGGHGNGRQFQLAAEAFPKLLNQFADNARGSGVIHYKSVTDDLGEFQRAGHRLAFGIDHDDHDIGSAKIHAHKELFARGKLSGFAYTAFQFADLPVNGRKVHGHSRICR